MGQLEDGGAPDDLQHVGVEEEDREARISDDANDAAWGRGKFGERPAKAKASTSFWKTIKWKPPKAKNALCMLSLWPRRTGRSPEGPLPKIAAAIVSQGRAAAFCDEARGG